MLAQRAPLWLDLEQQPGQWEEKEKEEEQGEGARASARTALASTLPAGAAPASPEREPLLDVAVVLPPSAPRS